MTFQRFTKTAKSMACSTFAAAFLATAFVGVPTYDAAAQNVVKLKSGRTTASVAVTKGKPKTVKTDLAFSEIVVGDPGIADVRPLTNKSFYVLGSTLGTTGLALFDENKALVGMVDVEVTQDTGQLKATLKSKVPGSKIKVSSANGRIVLSGTAKDPVAAAKAAEIAKKFGGDEVINSMEVEGSQQVQLEVRFVEASRTAGKRLGISLSNNGNNNFSSGRGGGGFASMLTRILTFKGVGVDALIEALEGRGIARRLAEPNLIARSGEEASFLAGGEYPIPVSDGQGGVTVTYKNYGVGLKFVPTVLADGLMHLKVEPEVSQIDRATGVSVNGTSVPGLIVRRASTSVELRDGQSYVIAGLLQTVNERDIQRMPWLGEIPIIGALFTSRSYQKRETDLVIIVTPRLVKPLAPGQEPATPLDATRAPNDAEFFIAGQDEISTTGSVLGMIRKTITTKDGEVLPTGHFLSFKTNN